MLWETPEFKYVMNSREGSCSDEEFLRAVLSLRNKKTVAQIVYQFAVTEKEDDRFSGTQFAQMMNWGQSIASRAVPAAQHLDVLFEYFYDFTKDFHEWGHLGFEEYLVESPPWPLRPDFVQPAVERVKRFLGRSDIPVGVVYGSPWHASFAPAPNGAGIVTLSSVMSHLEPWTTRLAQLGIIWQEDDRTARRHIAQASLPYLAHYIFDTIYLDEKRAFWSLQLPELDCFDVDIDECGKTAAKMLYFVILHEFSHILLKHPEEMKIFPSPLDDASLQRQHEMEHEADNCAANLLAGMMSTEVDSMQHMLSQDFEPSSCVQTDITNTLFELFLLMHFGEQSLPGTKEETSGLCTHPSAATRYQRICREEPTFRKVQRLADESLRFLEESGYPYPRCKPADDVARERRILIQALAKAYYQGPYRTREEFLTRLGQVMQAMRDVS